MSVIISLLTSTSKEKPFGKVSATYFQYSCLKHFKMAFFFVL